MKVTFIYIDSDWMHNFCYIIVDYDNCGHSFDSLREVSRDGEFTVERDIWIVACFIAYNGHTLTKTYRQF
jgi:hypothetical protein